MKHTLPIILYGPPGSGKSSVAQEITRQLDGFEYIDTDTLIAETYGTVHHLIQSKGEAYFRELEANTLLDLSESSSGKKIVISLGGGSLLKRTNMGFINQLGGRIFVLKTHWNTLFQRILADDTSIRPLIQEQELFQSMMEKRASHYSEFERQIQTDKKTIRQIADEILTYSK